MACFRNGWKHRVLFLNHMAATISVCWEMLPVELQAVLPHGGKGSFLFLLVEPFPYLVRSSPELGTQRGRAASSSWWPGLSPFTQSAGNGDRLPCSTLWVARPRGQHSSANHPPGLTVTFDKRHLMSTATIIMA